MQITKGIRFPYMGLVVAASLLLVACGQLHTGDEKASTPELKIAAASDLQPAFEELGRIFEQETGVRVTFSFGSTGNLTRQVENGLPVDLFAAANVAFIDQLEKQALIIPDTKALYARGRITIWTRAEASFKVDKLEDLARPEIKRIAIANPEHAPYGQAAKEALQTLKLWDAVQAKLVFGENVRQATQFAETGNAEVALTALSLSLQSHGRWTLIPQDLHRPLDQALAIIKSTKHEPQARQFTAFLNSPTGQTVMTKYGFSK